MNVIQFAIENPVKIAVSVILVILFGTLSVFNIPIQLTPDVDQPVITVTTRWSGASPQEIESEIVDRQEDKLKSVTNLKKMTSTSVEGEAKVLLEFPVGIDKDVAYRDVSDKLRQVTDYPEEVDEPVMSVTDNDMANTIAWMILYAREGDDVAHLKTFIEDNVKPQLERAEGIAEVPVFGGLDREIRITIDPHVVAAKGLTFREIESALRRENVNISAGTVAQGKRDYTYRTVGEYRTIEDIENTVVAYREGGPILVRDISEVVDGFKKRVAFVRSKGRRVIAMPAKRETGANVIQAMESLRERVAIVNEEILKPRGLGLELTQVYDETIYIWSAIGLVAKNIVVGGALAVIVLLLFLRSGSATGIIAVTIPISAIGTFLSITLLDRTLNVVMLAGMAFAVGMVVDNAIVVLENIYRHRSMGKTQRQAALDGAKEVWGAILASTLTTMAVFLPVIFIEEEAGQLFKDIAIAISSAVGFSLLVSVFVIPPLASRFFSGTSALRSGESQAWRIAEWVAGVVAAINRRISTRLAVVVGFSTAAIIASWLLMPAAEYLPAGNQNLVFGFLITPPGYSVDEFQRMAEVVEEGDPVIENDGIRPAWEAELGSEKEASLPPVNLRLGLDGKTVRRVPAPPIDNFFFVSFNGTAFMGATSKEPTSVKPLVEVLKKAGNRIPGIFSFFSQTSLFRSGKNSGNSVGLELRSESNEAVVQAASAVMGQVMAHDLGRPSPDPTNFSLGRPEVQLVPNRARAADLGLNVQDIGFTAETCIDGAFVGEFNDHGDKIDLTLKVAGTEGATVEEIGRIPIFTPTGHIVPLASTTDLIRTTAPQQVNHIEEMNAVSFSIHPKIGVPLQETMRVIEDDIIAPLRASGAISDKVITSLSGTADKLTQTKRALIGNFEGIVTKPRLFGLSIIASIALLVGVIVIATTAGAFINGRNASLKIFVFGAAALIVGVFAANPTLLLESIQSRAILALLITYLLMAALFESFIYPFVIMFTVPLATVGGFIALRIVHEISLYDITSPIQQLDVLTMLGFVILVGIVVNNAILIVHQALTYMRSQGMQPSDAVAMAVQVRTRPIFMSAMTSIFGMAPLVIMTGAGSELYRGLGSVVLGGLLLSTVFTLVVIPATFSLVMDLQAFISHSRKVNALPQQDPLSASVSATGQRESQ